MLEYVLLVDYLNNIILDKLNMILDAILLILIVLGLQIIKSNYPNFLFFPKGAVLFLPPQDPKDPKPRKNK
jgi:hypothetical protein